MITSKQVALIFNKWDNGEAPVSALVSEAASIGYQNAKDEVIKAIDTDYAEQQKQEFLDQAMIAIWSAQDGMTAKLSVVYANELWQAREADRLARKEGEK